VRRCEPQHVAIHVYLKWWVDGSYWQRGKEDQKDYQKEEGRGKHLACARP
jgi:hypothetical protein